MRKSIWVVFVLLSAVASGLPACTGTADDANWLGTEVDSAGIRWIHNPVQGIWGEGEGWTFTETLTIEAPEGEPIYEFGRITGMDLGPDGRLFVLDGMAGEIRVFDLQGAYLETIGRRGQGPGELSRGPGGVFVMSDGRVAVPDMGNQRLNWFESPGPAAGAAEVPSHHSIRISYADGFPVRWDGDDLGNVVVQRRAMGGNEDSELAEGDPLARLGETEGEERFLILPPAKTVWMVGDAPRFKIFETEPTWDLGPSGTLRTGMTGAYSIEVRDPDGTVRMVITKDHTSPPVRESDRERYLALFRAALDRIGLPPRGIQRQVDGISFGADYPAITEIMEGPGGTTLVRGVQAVGDMEILDLAEEMSKRLGSSTWDVFDERGRYQGPVQLPPRFTPMVWTDGAVYGRWLDELDRPYVKRLEWE